MVRLFSFTAGRNASVALQVARIAEGTLGGLVPITSGVLWGADADTTVGAEGPQPESDTFGQHATIAGVRLLLQPSPHVALSADFGESWFSAQYFSAPGLPTPGQYAHVGIDRSWNTSGASIDLYRFTPAYAPNVLLYATTTNIWPVAWAWPAPWLKESFPDVDNSEASINRQGFRVGYRRQLGHFDARLGVATFAQVTPFNSVTSQLPGFTDAFFTSRIDQPLSYRGTQTQLAGWFAWRAGAYSLSADFVDDTLHRPFPVVAPEEAVDLHDPQFTVTLSHSNPYLTYAAGEGRFGIAGAYALGNRDAVDVHQCVLFAGLTAVTAPRVAWLLEWRRYITGGAPIVGETEPPAYTGTRLILEQRFSF